MQLKIQDFDKLNIKPKIGDRIFLYGDLGAGKTTISKYILNNILGVKEDITSPTYNYYNKYKTKIGNLEINIYHFDLYRLKNYDEFFNIAGEDIFDNENNIILVEWPEIIENYYNYTIKIDIKKTGEEDSRNISIKYFNK